MKKIVSIFALVFALAPVSFVQASEGHDHEGESSSVGPDKGITDYDDHSGFKLSSEAVKNFALKFQTLSGKNSWSIPNSAILYSGEEVNVYRVRAGFYKRVDFRLISKDDKQTQIKSVDLQEGDQIVVEGIGFLRAAEIVVTDGAPEGHSH